MSDINRNSIWICIPEQTVLNQKNKKPSFPYEQQEETDETEEKFENLKRTYNNTMALD